MKSYTFRQWNEMKAKNIEREATGKVEGAALAILVGLLILALIQ